MSSSLLKKTPLNAWHRNNGAKMVDFGGWEMPVQYQDGILREHLSTRRAAGLFDVSHMGRLKISGNDRLVFLQHVLSNNAELLCPGDAQYTLLPDENGGVIDDAYLYRLPEAEYLLVVNASNLAKDLQHLQRLAKDYKELEIKDVTDVFGMIAFQGLASEQIIDSLLESGQLPGSAHNKISSATIAGTEVYLASTGYTGEPVGFEIFIPAKKTVQVWSRIMEAGNQAGVVAVGLGARDTLRLEAGMPLYGHEFGLDSEKKEIPAFAFPLTRLAVSFADCKGDFVGRSALEKQFVEVKKLQQGSYRKSQILPRRFKSLALLDRGVIRNGNAVYVDGRQVGFVTSGTVTPYWEFSGTGSDLRITDKHSRRAIALAYLDAELKPGEEVEVAVRKQRLRAIIVKQHSCSTPPYFKALISEQP